MLFKFEFIFIGCIQDEEFDIKLNSVLRFNMNLKIKRL